MSAIRAWVTVSDGVNDAGYSRGVPPKFPDASLYDDGAHATVKVTGCLLFPFWDQISNASIDNGVRVDGGRTWLKREVVRHSGVGWGRVRVSEAMRQRGRGRGRGGVQAGPFLPLSCTAQGSPRRRGSRGGVRVGRKGRKEGGPRQRCDKEAKERRGETESERGQADGTSGADRGR